MVAINKFSPLLCPLDHPNSGHPWYLGAPHRGLGLEVSGSFGRTVESTMFAWLVRRAVGETRPGLQARTEQWMSGAHLTTKLYLRCQIWLQGGMG